MLTIGRFLLGGLSGLWRFIRTNPALCGVLALCAVSAWLWHGKNDALEGKARAEHQITLEIASHRATKQAYRTAQAQAQQAEKARLVRVQAEYERNNADAKQGYARNIADLDARYQRLRDQERARTIAFGATANQPVSEATAVSCRAFGAPCTDELLAALKDAEETAIRLVALQALAKRQGGVPVN